MSEPLIGLLGVVGGILLGGTGKYWQLRRDAWGEARASGLLLLADVRALLAALHDGGHTARVVSDTELGVKSWESHREVLASFRRGNFPNGFRAPEWLTLADHFAQLKELSAASDHERVLAELRAAEGLLKRFEDDPKIFWYIVAASFQR